MKHILAVLAALMAAGSGATVSAAMVFLSRTTREVTPEEIAAGAPAGYVHDFFIDSDTDILSFSGIGVDVPLYQHAFGTDSAAPAEGLAEVAPTITADSYITTPGPTAMLGGGFVAGGDRLWGDLTDDGPQRGFHFARLTVGETGTFTGNVAVKTSYAPIYLPFNFALPGRASDLTLLASEPKYALDYSLDPPTPTLPEPPPSLPVDPPSLPIPAPPIVPPSLPTDPPFVPVDPPALPDVPPSSGGGSNLGRVTMARQSRTVTPDEISGGAPTGGYVHDFFVSSDTDILSFSSVGVDVPLYQNSFGSDSKPPAEALAEASTGVTADSYITTPGDTMVLGGGFEAEGDNVWGDLTDDGPQRDFHFARLTVDQTGTFTGRVTVKSPSAPVNMPFNFSLPASEADMARLASEPTPSLEYSLDPPPSEPPTPPTNTPPLPTEPAPVNPITTLSRVTIARQSRAVTPEEIAGGAPSSGFVHEFRITTDSDILSISNVAVDSTLYQNPLGGDNVAPPTELAELNPALGADSFIQLPGSTVMLGPGFAGGSENLWGDLSNDGAQTDFLFARLTVDQTSNFTGKVSVRAGDSFASLPFDFMLPGTADDLASLAPTQSFVLEAMTIHTPPAPEPTPVQPLPPFDPLPPVVGPPQPPVDPVIPTPDAPPDTTPPSEPTPIDPGTIVVDPSVDPSVIDPSIITLPHFGKPLIGFIRPAIWTFPIDVTTGIAVPYLYLGHTIDLAADIDVTDVLFGTEFDGTVAPVAFTGHYTIHPDLQDSFGRLNILEDGGSPGLAVLRNTAAGWQLANLGAGLANAVVPEPAAAVLVCFAPVALAWARRRCVI